MPGGPPPVIGARKGPPSFPLPRLASLDPPPNEITFHLGPCLLNTAYDVSLNITSEKILCFKSLLITTGIE